jgi:hypothetical protein
MDFENTDWGDYTTPDNLPTFVDSFDFGTPSVAIDPAPADLGSASVGNDANTWANDTVSFGDQNAAGYTGVDFGANDPTGSNTFGSDFFDANPALSSEGASNPGITDSISAEQAFWDNAATGPITDPATFGLTQAQVTPTLADNFRNALDKLFGVPFYGTADTSKSAPLSIGGGGLNLSAAPKTTPQIPQVNAAAQQAASTVKTFTITSGINTGTWQQAAPGAPWVQIAGPNVGATHPAAWNVTGTVNDPFAVPGVTTLGTASNTSATVAPTAELGSIAPLLLILAAVKIMAAA